MALLPAADEAFWKSLLPGRRMLLHYASDDVWHERLLLWPSSSDYRRWVIETPDEDMYAELLDGTGGADRFQPIDETGFRPPLGLPVYAFQGGMGRTTLMQKIVEGAVVGRSDAAARRETHIGSPTEMTLWGGGRVPVPAAAASRRLIRKGPGATGDPAVYASPPVLPLAAGVPTTQPATAAPPAAQAVTPAPEGVMAVTPAQVNPAAAPATQAAQMAAVIADDPDEEEEDVVVDEGLWLLEDSVEGMRIGDLVPLPAGAKVMGDRAIGYLIRGGERRVVVMRRALNTSDIGSCLERIRREIIVKASSVAPATGVTPSGTQPADDSGAKDDMRTLAVVYDAHGERRDFRDAVREMQEDDFTDWPVDDPRTVLWILKSMSRDSLAPVAWVERYLTLNAYSDTDRSQYELRAIARISQMAVLYDQLNLPSLACFELLARRWQLILDAHARNPLAPDYSSAEYFDGTSHSRTGVAPMLTMVVARQQRDDAEVETQRQNARDLRVAKLDAKRKLKGAHQGDEGGGAANGWGTACQTGWAARSGATY